MGLRVALYVGCFAAGYVIGAILDVTERLEELERRATVHDADHIFSKTVAAPEAE